MLELLLNKMEALINERGSAAVLREHLGLLRERIGALERENADLRSQAEQAKAGMAEQQDKVRRFANDNPKGWRCDHCGGGDLMRIGSKPDPTFGVLGIKQAIMSCRVCNRESLFTDD